MTARRFAAWTALIAVGLLALAAPARAQSLDDKLRAQLRAALQQLSDLQNSQAGLQAQKAAAEQERDAAKAKLAAAGSARPARPAGPSPAQLAELDTLKAENARLTQALQQSQAENASYKDAYAKVVDSSQQVHAERDRLAQDAATAKASLAECETKNITLVKIGRDVLAAYAKVGVMDALKRGEPMIGLKRVKMEQIAQDYADKVYEAKFDPRAVKRPAAPANPAATAPAVPPTPSGPAPAKSSGQP